MNDFSVLSVNFFDNCIKNHSLLATYAPPPIKSIFRGEIALLRKLSDSKDVHACMRLGKKNSKKPHLFSVENSEGISGKKALICLLCMFYPTMSEITTKSE